MNADDHVEEFRGEGELQAMLAVCMRGDLIELQGQVPDGRSVRLGHPGCRSGNVALGPPDSLFVVKSALVVHLCPLPNHRVPIGSFKTRYII